jgi:hypothetical protein
LQRAAEIADTCGVSKSNVIREATEAGEEALKELWERRFDELELLVIYINGMAFGDHHMISAVGADADERKHVLASSRGDGERGGARVCARRPTGGAGAAGGRPTACAKAWKDASPSIAWGVPPSLHRAWQRRT